MTLPRAGTVCTALAFVALALSPPAQGEERVKSRAEAGEVDAESRPPGESKRPVGPTRELSDPYAPRPVADRPGQNRAPLRGTRRGTRVPRPGPRGAR